MVAAYTLSESNHHENTRLYLQSLMSGQKPDIRPEFGAWEPVVKLAEDAFASAKKEALRGETVQKLLTSLKKMSKKYPGLKALLEEKPVPGQRNTEQEEAASESLMPALPESAQIDPRKALGACQWLDDFIAYSKQVSPEGYEDFHEGVGLWALSTVVAGRATIYHGERGIGTSLNIALCADTTMTAKTETANVGVDVLEAADLGWLLGPDETTPQKMLSDMAGTQPPTNYDSLTDEKRELIRQRLALAGQRGWFYDEFGALLRSMGKQNGPMADFKGLLLKVDGSMRSYTYATKSSGTERIENPRLSLLACMTPPDLKASMKSGAEDLSNGFLPRFAVITPPADLMVDAPFDLKRKPVPFNISQPLKRLHDRLGMPSLNIIEKHDNEKDPDKVTGHAVERGDLPVTEMEVDGPVVKAWQTYRSALKQLVVPPAMRDFRGFYGRYPTLALRIATLFTILEGTTIIQMRHWAKAQEITERWRKSLHELYRQINDKEPGQLRQAEDEVKECIEKLIAQNVPVTAREIGRRLKKLSTGQIRTVLIDLKQSGDILEQKSESGRTVHYVLADG